MVASPAGVDVERIRQAVTAVAAARPDDVVDRMVREAARLAGAPLAAMTVLAAGRDQLALVSVFGTGGIIREGPLPVARSVNGDVITSGRSFRSADMWRDARVRVSDIARRNRVRSLLIVPLPARGALEGTIATARRGPRPFSAHDEVMLQEFAGSVHIPVEHARARVAPSLARPFAQRGPDRESSRSLLDTATGESPFTDKPPPAVLHRLTPRERDVLRLLLADHTCKQVASTLGLSQRTVEHYLDRLKLRFGKATLHGLATIVLAEQLLA